MKRRNYLIFIALTIVSGLVGGAISNYLFMARPAVAQESNLSPGLERYIPTRMEWLALHLQSYYSFSMNEYGCKISFINAVNESDTLIIYCRYLPTADREKLNALIEGRKLVAQIAIKHYGWEDWVQIKEDVKMSS